MTTPPDRKMIGDQLRALIAGEVGRERVADWAAGWVVDDHADIDDPAARSALEELAGADLKVNPREYLHGDDDFRAWLMALDGPDATE